MHLRAVCPMFLAVAVALVLAAYAASGGADDWRNGRDVPPGWVGLLTGGGMVVGEAAGVYLGNGRIVTAAHALPAYEVGWRIDVYQPQGMGNPVLKRRAVVKALDTHSDIARLELIGPAEFTSAQACAEAPKVDERVLFFKVARERQTMTAVVSVQTTYLGLRKIPEHVGGPAESMAGQERYAFTGAAEPGMSGGGAYSVERGCLFGIASLVDVVPRDPDAIGSNSAETDAGTFVIPAALLTQ